MTELLVFNIQTDRWVYRVLLVPGYRRLLGLQRRSCSEGVCIHVEANLE